ncbi:MAG: hypothetical protein ACQGVK_12320 [Myxococcota bacterium]
MSVNGEFLRVLGAYIELLESSEAAGASECASRLRAIHSSDRESWGGSGLEDAARRVLEQTRSDGAIARVRFARAAERERFATDTEHLVALCRAIAGSGRP